MNKLTSKQQKFVEAYCGNATEAARIAGYKQPAIQGHENLQKPNVKAAIEARDAEPKKIRIATREERQGFWTGVMENTQTDMKDRLRASELLGKSGADFIERKDHKHSFLNPDGTPLNLKAKVTFVLPGEVDK
jgi:phage terminase small subunit